MYNATGNSDEEELEAYKKEVDRHDVHMIRTYIIAMLALFGVMLLGAVFPKNILCVAIGMLSVGAMLLVSVWFIFHDYFK